MISQTIIFANFELNLILSELDTALRKLAYNCVQCSIFIGFYVQVQQQSIILNSFMYCPFVCIQISLLREMLAAFPARVSDSFMYFPFVCIKISLLREMFSAFTAKGI